LSEKDEEASSSTARTELEELLLLRKLLREVQGRNSRFAGVAFLVLSATFLVLAYQTRYLLFETVSVVSLLLGVVFVFSSIEPCVKLNVANEAVVSALLALNKFLKHFKIKGKAVYIPSLSEGKGALLFLPRKDGDAIPNYDEIMEGDSIGVERGIVLPSLGTKLVQLYESELDGLKNLDFEYLTEWLPRVLVEELQVAEKVEIYSENELVHIRFSEPVFRHVCQHNDLASIRKSIGCPLCSSIAETLARNTHRLVFFSKCDYDVKSRIAHAVFTLGPNVESLKEEAHRGKSVDEKR